MRNDGHQNAWDNRYQLIGPEAAGTFDHTKTGNIQFYRAKCDALDRCISAIGTSFQGKKVLDAAGGSGQFIPYYISRGCDCITITDYSEVALQFVRKKWQKNPNVTAIFMDLTEHSPEIEKTSYDFILVQEAIFLLPDYDALDKAIANLSTYLAPGGYLILSDLFPEEEIIASPYVTYRSRSAFEKLLTKSGLNTITYIPQTAIFNRSVFGPLQRVVEQFGSLYYWLDRLAQKYGVRCPPHKDIKYLIAHKK